ncbi:MAG TPA: SDR family NAD(P)-dependent oxidoreductase, partial [Blastocatellia bacterium]|nr:SDR family NAD(P)-dependent oxidoreductase [Blastocatellia bacterium]
MSRLQGKAALITGAGSGIGRQAALLFAAEGARVAVLDRDLASAQEVVASIRDAKGEAIAVHADVTEAESDENAVRRAVEAFGALHVIFNNAGGSSSRDGKVTEAPFDEFWRAIKLDLWGTWLVCHYGIPELIKSGGGSVINASSVVALMGWPGKDAYTAAKGGVHALTKQIAVE